MQTLRLTLASVVLILVACAPGPAPAPAEAGPAIPLTDCVLSTPGVPGQADAQCGTLSVPENRADPSSRSINLRVAVVPAVSRSPAPDPLFILAGGPGQAATEVYPVLASSLQRIAQERDIVLVDQRGTGGSNPLRCTPRDSEEADLTETREAAIARQKACPARLDADPSFYTTLSAMQDLDAVRAALGYDQINLYGGSYGTRAALAYLRLYPEHVRSLVLDGVVSPDYLLLLDAPRDGQRSLDMLLARCAADAACQAAFPDLQDEVQSLFDQVEASPVQVQMPDPVTAEPLNFPLTHDAFAGQLFNLLYAPETVALVPLDVHAAATRGDFAPLLGLALSSEQSVYDGMFYAVACAEDAPLLTAQAAQAEAKGTLFGDMSAGFREICTGWPRGAAPDEFRQPIQSDVPALLLSGEADPVTPPQYAEVVAQGLPNSLHLIAPGMGHGNLIRGCIPQLVSDFVAQASVAGLDVACVSQIDPPPFFLRPTGPNP
jgi:pimeloyl-ACP methyl ester carboxylesterase